MDHEVVKMGFEKDRNRIDSAYGNHHTIELSDRTLTVKSDAEEWFARMADALLQAGAITEWAYEPEVFPISYKYHRCGCGDTYTPDFRLTWSPETSLDGTQYIEVKRGKLDSKYAGKIKRFCQQYEHALVLVWFGPLPKKGKVKARIDKLIPWLHHVWKAQAPGRGRRRGLGG